MLRTVRACVYNYICYGPLQLPENLENIKTKSIVLVHGEGFGAWCWYKTIALLEESGLLPTALDLTGSGIELTDTKDVNTIADYSKPLIEYLQNLPLTENVGNSKNTTCSFQTCNLLDFGYLSLNYMMAYLCAQVILVGHSTGGACISYALDQFPQKISKAIFLCGTMVSDGQRPFDVFAEQVLTYALFTFAKKA